MAEAKAPQSQAQTSEGGSSYLQNNRKKLFELEMLRSPKSNIKIMFLEYQKELKQLREEKKNLDDKIDDLEYQLTEKEDRIVSLEQTQQEHISEIEKLQDEVKQYYKERQANRQLQFKQLNSQSQMD